ncbi:MAG: serine hydrolase, partial [Rhodocyclaceae bacterium]|nr:serine hydrolase [Rhodocyclaceae bacterium]
MRMKSVIIAGVALVFIAGGWLHKFPPELIRVGASYTAKIVCSNVFIAGRDPESVLALDVQSPGHPLLSLMRVDVDRERGSVQAALLGFIGDGLAINRPGTGCASVPDGNVAMADKYRFTPLVVKSSAGNEKKWPSGNRADTNLRIQKVIEQDALAGSGMRGIAVIHEGRLVAQRYADGFTQDTPLLGWSMTKSVTAALVGIQVADEKIRLDQDGWWHVTNARDGRAAIKISDLMAMSSGLHFNEGYGNVSDVTRMLYLESDMAAYARAQPLEHPVGTIWNYSSGTTVLLSAIWQAAAGAESLLVPRQRLFGPLGMKSAVLEVDARGNFVGSSYMYATTQDWARFGQFLLQDGQWDGKRILPDGFVKLMSTVAPASKGAYGQGQVWRWGPGGESPQEKKGDADFGLPADTFWMLGHDGQSVAIVPSRKLVVVRLGLTPSRLHYKPQAMLAEVIKALGRP